MSPLQPLRKKRLQKRHQQTLLMMRLPQRYQMLKCLQSLWQKPPLSNPRRRHVLWLLCVVTTGQVKNAPKLHPQVADAMASQAASLVTNPALVVMANQAVTVVVRALPRVAHAWVMQHSEHNAMLWSQPKMSCAVWRHKRTAKC